MKYLFTLLSLLLFFNLANSQTYTYSLAKSFYSSNSSEDFGNDMAIKDSTIAVVSNYGGTKFWIDGIPHTTPNGDNGFLAIFDTLGNFKPLISKSFSGPALETADEVCIDDDGNIIVAGTSTGTSVSFGTSSENITQGGNMAVFVAKFNVSGDLVWSKIIENDDTVRVNSMELNSSGEILLAGDFKGSDITIGANTLSSNGDFDGFVAKILSNGDDDWGYSFGHDTTDITTDIFVTPNDSLLVTGSFLSDSLIIEGDTLLNASTLNGYDGVHFKLNPEGTPVYSEAWAGPSDVFPTEIVEKGDTLYMAIKHKGYFYGHTASGYDVQLFRFDDNVFQWNKLISSSGDETVQSMQLDADGNIFIAGYSDGGTLSIDTEEYTNQGAEDFFVAKFDADGNVLETINKGNFGSNTLNALAVHNQEIYTVGEFNQTTLYLGADTLSNFGGYDVWMGKLEQNTLPSQISLTPSSFPEDIAPGSLVGTFAVSDPDDDTHTFVMENGVQDNDLFTIATDGDLYTNASFDYEAATSHSLLVGVYDSKGGYFETNVNVFVTDVNEDPIALNLSNQTINENYSGSSNIGNFSATDPDNSSSFTYSLVEGTGDADNDRFSIINSSLKPAVFFDAETESEVSIRVRVSDGNGGTLDSVFVLTIEDYIVTSTLQESTQDIASFGGNDELNMIELDASENRYMHGKITGDVDFQGTVFSSTSGYFLAKYTPQNSLEWIVEAPAATDIVVTDTLYLLNENKVFKANLATGAYFDTLSLASTDYTQLAVYNDTLYLGTGNWIEMDAKSLGGEQYWNKRIDDVFFSYITDLVVTEDYIYAGAVARNSFTADGVTISQNFENNDSFFARLLAFSHDGTLQWGKTMEISPGQTTGFSSGNKSYSENIDIGPNGNIHLFGRFSTHGSDPLSLIIDETAYAINGEGFIVRVTPDENVTLVVAEGSIDAGKVDNNGNIFTIKNNYLKKYDATGATLWGNTIAGSQLNDMELISSRALIGGSFNSSITFDGTTTETIGDNGFFAEVGTNNDENYIEFFGNDNSWYEFNTMASNNQGHVVVAGHFEGDVAHLNDTLEHNKYQDYFMAYYQLGDTLNKQWLRAFGSDEYDQVRDITLDESGNIYVLGKKTSDSTFVLKTNAMGDTLWVLPFAGMNYPQNIEVNASGDVFVAGYFSNTTVTINGTDYNNTSVSGIDAIVAKISSNGTVDWANHITGSNSEYLYQVIPHGDSIYITGRFNSEPLTVNGENLIASGGLYKSYIIKMDDMGQNLWLKDYTDQFSISAVLYQGNIYTVGNNVVLKYDELGNQVAQSELNVSGQLKVDGNYIYAWLNTSEIAKFDTDLNLLDSYEPEEDPTIAYEVKDDTLMELLKDKLLLVIVRDGPEGFVLSTNSIDENTTGFMARIEPESGMHQGDYEVLYGDYELQNDSVFAITPFNYENDSINTLELRLTDSLGETLTRQFTVRVQDVNEMPSSISFSSFTVLENEPVGTAVGTISGVDPDVGDSLTFQPADSLSNVLFYADGDTIRQAVSINFEELTSQNTLNFSQPIVLEATDKQGLSLTNTFSVQLENVNEMPTGIHPVESAEDVSPNQSSQYISNIAPVDEDNYWNFDNYSFGFADNGPDNEYFSISGISLYANNDTVLNYELDSLYNLSIKIYHMGDSVVFPLQVKLSDENDPISQVALTMDSVAENLPDTSFVSRVIWSDEDTAAWYEMSVYSYEENFFFKGDSLMTSNTFNYEQQTAHDVGVRLSDTTAEYTTTRHFEIHVIDKNDLPYLITTSVEISENDTTEITNMVAHDPDGDAFYYFLTTGEGDSANYKVMIDSVSGKLSIHDPFNYEADSTTTIRIMLRDEQGGTDEFIVPINILDANDVPYNIHITNHTVEENENAGERFVSKVFYDDVDPSSENRITLVTMGNEVIDSYMFTARDDSLFLQANRADYETKDSLYIRVGVIEESNEGTMQGISDSILIKVLDVNDEKPVIEQDQTFAINEDVGTGTVLGTLEATDLDANTTFENWQIINGDSDGVFNLDPTTGELMVADSTLINYEWVQSYVLTVTVEDGVNQANNASVIIDILDVNESPWIIDSIDNMTSNEVGIYRTLDLSFVFYDPETDALTYSASSDNESVATTSITGFTLQVDLLANGEATITVTADDGNGNSVQQLFTVTVDDGTSVSSNPSGVVSLYPNPTRGQVYIKFSEKLNQAVVNIYDYSGKKTDTFELENTDEGNVKIEEQPGIYFIEIVTDKNKWLRKIIVQ